VRSPGETEAGDAVSAVIGPLPRDGGRRARGLLRTAIDNVDSGPDDGGPEWRSEIEVRVLYEYAHDDHDGAGNLIARIPVLVDPETAGSPDREITTVTDGLTRWDGTAAPTLVVRGPRLVTGLAAYVNAGNPPPARAVTLTRTYDGAPAPALFTDLAGCLDHVGGSGAPTRNARLTVATFTGFLALLTPVGGAVTGDFGRRALRFPPPIELATGLDRLELAYDGPAFEAPAVCYLRAEEAPHE
jgi:hypothetical protein